MIESRFFFVMIRRPPRSTRTDTLFPYTTLFRSLNRAAVSPNDSFVTLEGDSLSYVSVASELDRRLGYLPEDWEHLTVAEIDALEPRTQTPADKLLKPCDRSEEHTSELQSLMRISYAVFCLKKNSNINNTNTR